MIFQGTYNLFELQLEANKNKKWKKLKLLFIISPKIALNLIL
jgi:hypothetical protein